MSDPDDLTGAESCVGWQDDTAAFACGLVGFFAFGAAPFSAFSASTCSDAAWFAFARAAFGVHVGDHPARYIDGLVAQIGEADGFFGFGAAFQESVVIDSRQNDASRVRFVRVGQGERRENAQDTDRQQQAANKETCGCQVSLFLCGMECGGWGSVC